MLEGASLTSIRQCEEEEEPIGCVREYMVGNKFTYVLGFYLSTISDDEGCSFWIALVHFIEATLMELSPLSPRTRFRRNKAYMTAPTA